MLALTGGPVDEDTRETLTELDAHDRAAASAVAGRLAEGGAADVAAWVRAEPVELLYADAQTWHLIGRLLLEQGEFAAAESAYETAARGTNADVARHLVAAATAARIAGAPDRAEALIGRARDAGGDPHPSAVLVDAPALDRDPAEASATRMRCRHARTRRRRRSTSHARRSISASATSTRPAKPTTARKPSGLAISACARSAPS